SLTSVRMLAPCLTPENHQEVLARASGRSRREIEALVAKLAPRPDVAPSIRKLPAPATAQASPAVSSAASPTEGALPPTTQRPIIETTSPDRYRVQFTLGKEGHDRLRRLQDLLRREIPKGDPGLIVERALALLLEHVEKSKFAATKRTQRPRPIRPGADRSPTLAPSRDIPNRVQRAAWARDGG